MVPKIKTTIENEVLRKKYLDGFIKLISKETKIKRNKVKELVSNWIFTLTFYNKMITDPLLPFDILNKESNKDWMLLLYDLRNVSRLTLDEHSLQDKLVQYWDDKIDFKDKYLSQGETDDSDYTIVIKSIRKNRYKTLTAIKEDKEIDNVNIFTSLYNKLVSLYNGDKKEMDKCIFLVTYRYIKVLGDTNNQLSLTKYNFDKLRKLGYDFELFASPFNVTSKYYCSAFIDTDAPFGSLGSFSQINLTSGLYEVNPPYSEAIMRDSIIKIDNTLSKSKGKLKFIIYIPIWDAEMRKKLGRKVAYTHKYEALEVAKKSKYTLDIKVLRKEDYMFYSNVKGKQIAATDVYEIVMSN